ncbi:hypothetical protein PENSPDRAFT_754883 [Peniophora sp. CONT]|nr:hypothetical protein PENSPDRAFT_754883 [Peniophora sp. CONT]
MLTTNNERCQRAVDISIDVLSRAKQDPEIRTQQADELVQAATHHVNAGYVANTKASHYDHAIDPRRVYYSAKAARHSIIAEHRAESAAIVLDNTHCLVHEVPKMYSPSEAHWEAKDAVDAAKRYHEANDVSGASSSGRA